MSAEAYPEGSTLERIGDNRQRRVLSVNLGSDAGRAMPVQSGDTLMIPRVLPELTDTVELKGHVYRPGPYQWRPGMRLSDLLESLQALRPGADPNYVLIRRESANDLQVTTLAADLALALAEPESDNNVRLEPRDEVHVFNLAFGRQRVIEPILQELKQQATYDAAYEEVRIAGRVRAPGSYPLQPGMRVSDLLRAGGNLDESAFTEEAELTRFTVVDGEYREKEVIQVNLGAILRGDTSSDLTLSPYDHLRISPVPDWNSDWSITLEGEVRFPGEYQILRGETLSDVMARAGGLTDRAFPEGAIFLREELREREREQIERLIRRMESDLASLSLQTAETTGAETLDLGQSLLEQLRTTEPTGRLVIDVEQILSRNIAERKAHDLELKDGDRLLIPGRSQSVTVLGEAQYPASHLYSPGLDRDEYIAKSGGLTRQADNKLIYVVRASGEVESGNRSRWFSRGSDAEIRPGDTIVVPLATDRIRPLTFWGNVTQILYQGAIAISPFGRLITDERPYFDSRFNLLGSDRSGERFVFAMPEHALGGSAGDEISLYEIWNILWQRKWRIIAVTVMFSITSVTYALLATDWYRAETSGLVLAELKVSPFYRWTIRGACGTSRSETLAVIRSRLSLH
ncbi:MAG: SLBB domain-containing protein [Woeseiaceae bacterium]|nr:SLBB domain-containing protein [Woeseiaceae bacterium]